MTASSAGEQPLLTPDVDVDLYLDFDLDLDTSSARSRWQAGLRLEHRIARELP